MTRTDSNRFRSGFIALAGRPNVGKSTLLNAYLKQNLAPVSTRPQTTRQQQLLILTLAQAQLIFVDTPGLHQPQHKLGERMNNAAMDAIADADVILALFDASSDPTEEDERVTEVLRSRPREQVLIAALNKVDLLDADKRQERKAAYQRIVPDMPIAELSATTGEGRQALLEQLIAALPQGPQYYPAETITDLYEREIAADWIRAACMQKLRQEVPYAIAVRIDEYKERGQTGAYIAATLFVERESQKGIVIGKGGSMLRDIGTWARQQIEAMSGRKVYLKLRVKTLPGWRQDESALKRFGYGKES